MELDEPRLASLDEVARWRSGRTETPPGGGLWVAGSVAGLAGRAVAVVGCRAASDAGRERARRLARDLAGAGVCIVSGLALGIDGSAHAGALDAGGATVGVLGGGHRRFFPRRNRALAEAMLAAGGAVVSPYPPDAPAQPWQFLERNAVVAGLADAVVVVEAAARSGSLNTAKWALERNIPVFAVPGDVDRSKAAGCNALIRDGAVLVRDAADVLEGIGLASAPLPSPAPSRRLSPLDAALLKALGDAPLSADDLFERLPAPAGDVLAALVRLELAGAIARREDLCYARLCRPRGEPGAS
jgi:DNA processing protein